MKYITSTLVLIALFGAQSEQANAIKLDAGFTDDLVKSLAADMAADAEKEANEPNQPALAQEASKSEAKVEKKAEKKTEKKAEQKTDKKADKKADAKKDAKQDAAKGKAAEKKVEKKAEKKAEEDEIPMDTAAIKAYSSVIADAAEDSEPATPVEYKAIVTEDEKPRQEIFSSDPMGSMIQNEISSIKQASIKAAQEKDDE